MKINISIGKAQQKLFLDVQVEILHQDLLKNIWCKSFFILLFEFEHTESGKLLSFGN